MNDFKTRLKQEYEELNDRIIKLNAFLDTKAKNTVDREHYTLLKLQALTMEQYREILKARLDLLMGEK